MERNCKTCQYNTFCEDGMVCANEESEYYTDYVEDSHVCVEWEEKECE